MNEQTELAIGQNVGSGLMPEVINGNVDARAVHGALGVRSDFSTWIKYRIEEFGFQEGEDFTRSFGRNHGARIDYSITLDMAKELAMVERNEMGRKMRRYFIECEKRLASGGGLHPPSPSTAGLSKLETALVDLAREHDARIGELESRMRPGADWQSVSAYLLAHYDLVLGGGRGAYVARRCMEESARRKLPFGEEKVRRGKSTSYRRAYAPEVLQHVVPPIIRGWAAKGKITLKGGEQ